MLPIPPPDPAAAPADRALAVSRRPWHAAGLATLRWLVIGALVALGIVMTAWLALRWAILPRIDQWRPQVEMRLSGALGLRVQIGTIRVGDGGRGLRLDGAVELRDVVLHEPDRGDGAAPREALRLPLVRAVLSPGSLLPGWDGRWQLRFAQLVIDGPRLEARRDAQGRIFVAGVAIEPGTGGEGGGGADWFFSQPEFVIRAGTLSWSDALRPAAPVVLTDVDLVARNGVRAHALRLDATPPPAWGQRFSLRGRFTQALLADAEARADGAVLARAGDWRRWRGSVYAELPALDLAALRGALELPFGVSQGHGALRAWLDVSDARWTALTADLALREVSLQPSGDLQPLAFARIDGRLAGRVGTTTATGSAGVPAAGFGPAPLEAPGGEIEARRFSFVTADGMDWPADDVSLRWRLDANGALAGGELRSPRLDLALLARIASRLPAPWVGAGLQDHIASLAPQGIASAVEARWEGPLEAPSRFLVKARVRGLALAAQPVGDAAAAAVPVLAAAVPASAAASAAYKAASANAPVPKAVLAAVPASASASSAYKAASANAPALKPVLAAVPANTPLAGPGRPGVQGADVDLSATEAGGEALVALRDGALEFPGVFELPRVPLERLDTRLVWRIDAGRDGAPSRIELRARDARLANADARASFDAQWSSGAALPDGSGRFPGVLNLSGQLVQADATRVARYLPLALGSPVRRYVERAVQGGQARTVDFKVRGDLRGFPFASAPGEFRIAAQLEGVRFAYLPGDPDWNQPGAALDAHPPWPAFADVKGELVFDKRSMELRNLQARLPTVGSGALQFTRIRGGIRNLSDQASLSVEGSGRGPLDDALRFVNATPVGGWIDGALTKASAPGTHQAPIDLQLALDIPLGGEGKGTRVRGQLLLAGNDLRLRPDVPLLADAKARISFGDDSFALEAGSARALGGELGIDGARQGDGSLRFTLQGSASADGLRRTPELGALARAATHLGGQTAYRLALGVVRGQLEWQLTSSLVGLSSDLPVPLGKTAAQSLPLRVQASLLPESAGNAALPRDQLRLELGAEGARVVDAQWQRELAPQGPRVLRGGVGVHEPAPQPPDGVSAALTLAQLDLDAWQDVLAAGPAGGAAADAGAGGAVAAGYAPTTLALRAQELSVGGRKLSRLVAGVSRGIGIGGEAGVWRLNLDAAELSGYGEYRPAVQRSGDAAGRVYARLSRLSLPEGEDDAVSVLLDQASPSSVPALDIVVEDFELRGKRLGRLEIEAQNRESESVPGRDAAARESTSRDAAGREWRLSKFRLDMPEAQFSAIGQWLPGSTAGARRRALLDFKLEVADGGALLARLGQGEVLRGAKGRLTGRLNWLGSPLEIDYPSLSGTVNVALDRGQFLKADPGIAKLLGVLSLQALPRRLLLDFRDVFQEGFAFDSVGGDVNIASGVASTRNLRMRGVQAVVLMEGSADIERETQDLRVWVVPEINTGTASLAFAAINPALGIGAFVAQWLLRRPIGEAGTREFHVTGPWAAPKVERIERKLRDPVPSLDEPASAPATAASAPFSPQESAP